MATSNSYRATSDTLKSLRPDGRLVLIGVSDESFAISSPSGLLYYPLQIIGSQKNGSKYLYEALDYVAQGKVKVLEETFPLENISDAYERVANGKVRFRAVVITSQN